MALPHNVRRGLTTFSGSLFINNKTRDCGAVQIYHPGHEVLSSLPLQMMLFFNVFYFPFWCLCEGIMLALKYGLLPCYYQFLLVAAFLILALAEGLRLYLGYTGNLQGKTVPTSVCEHSVHQERDASYGTNTPDDSEGNESEEKGDEDSEREEEWDTDLEIEETKEPFDPTGKTRYIAACQLYGVVPISYFLRHMKDTELIMKHHGLGPQGAKALSLALMTNTSIVKLNLSDNWLNGDGAAAVAEMLKENCYISDVDLSDNRLGVKGAEALSAMLLENTTVVTLKLSGNEFNDHAAKYLADALPANNKMKSLDLSHNMLADTSGELLGMAIAENTGLKELNISWNYFRSQGAAALARGFEANVFLRVLDLSYNGFNNNGAAALGEALKVNNVLEELNISNNRISLEGALRFAVGLKENRTLKSLNMARNPMQSEGCFGILKSIQANSGAVVEILDFSEIPVNKDFADLCDAVKMLFPNLQIRHGGNATLNKKDQPKVEIQSWFSVEGDS
uniref:Uncharacterized protein n=1 Tax=Chrysemys picta bellii TaxID=8478 RepID=A0A8C3P2N8_CHRPI